MSAIGMQNLTQTIANKEGFIHKALFGNEYHREQKEILSHIIRIKTQEIHRDSRNLKTNIRIHIDK